MLDTILQRPFEEHFLSKIARFRFFRKVTPAILTYLGLIVGLLVPISLYLHHPTIALALLLLSGCFDLLDGAVARAQSKASEVGATLDIFFDRIVEFSIILGFALYDPGRAMLCLFMLGSVLLCVTSFLVISLFTIQFPTYKSFNYSPGIIERFEAFLFFAVMIYFPSSFGILSPLFSFLVLFTGIFRVYQFSKRHPL